MPETAPTNPREPIPAAQMTPLDDVRMRLARVWLVGGGGTFMILVVQSLLHVYGDLTQEAWGWFLPTLMPSMGMIVTVLTYTALDPLMTGSVVRKTFVSIAMGLSNLYLATVILTILIQAFASKTADEAVGLMRTSNLWLGPLQGLVASALGVLFVSKEK